MRTQSPFAVVTPTLDGRVLDVLAGAEAGFTPGGLARLLTGASVEGVRKVLKRLAAQGIVTVEQSGNAHLFSLNREHIAAPAVLHLAGLRSILLERARSAVSGWTPVPVYGALFGSAARGTMRTDSDIDLFLVRDAGADVTMWEEQTHELADAMSRWTGNDTRVLEMSTAEVADAAKADDGILHSIAAEGLTIVGEPGWLHSRLRDAER